MNNQWDNSQDEWKLGYLAGIVDGEGSILIERIKRGKSGRYHYLPVVKFTGTHQGLVYTMQKEFGGNVNVIVNRLAKTGYQLSWPGKKGKEIINLILNKLIVKREQAIIYLTFPIGEFRHTPTYTDQEMALREAIYFKLKDLNRRSLITFTIGEPYETEPD